MRKVILYVAMSLDGYLADEKGSVDWLEGDGSGEDHSKWYGEFYESIDTILMGKGTYQQITDELSPGVWVYGDKKTFVFQHGEEKEVCKEVQLTNRPIHELVSWLKHRKGKDIWLCGGANLVAQCMEADLIDQYHINIVPTLLGKGLPLFSQGFAEKNLKLLSCRSENGMVDLVYEKRG